MYREQQLWAMEKNTKLGHRKGVQIGVCPDMLEVDVQGWLVP